MSKYEIQAKNFCLRHGVALRFKRGNKPPRWSPSGHHYIVALTSGGKDFVFDFWGSAHDAADGKPPSAYDILACLSSDSMMPPTPDEVAEEFGPMKPSEAIACAEFGKRLRAYFSAAELRDLREIA